MPNQAKLHHHHPDTLFDLPLYPQDPSSGNPELNSKFSLARAEKLLQTTPTNIWLDRGANRALHLFHAASHHVPAYRDFLHKHKIDASKIKEPTDLQHVPITDKENYLQNYPLDQLTWHGSITQSHTIVASSGTTGEPYFWPRSNLFEHQSNLEHELILARRWQLSKRSTLAIICFAMGIHIAGTTTAKSLINLNQRGFPISVMTPGNHMDNILRIIKRLSSSFNQVILSGYPPYIKEVLDQGAAKGINWSKINTRFLFAGEGFSESWRSHIADLSDSDVTQDIIGIYGSADAAVMGFETPISTTIRKHIDKHQLVNHDLFRSERQPFIYQYYPEHKNFESIDGELVLTSSGSIPLIRYNIHDQGNIITPAEVCVRVPALNKTVDPKTTGLPYVFVFGRSNNAVVMYGANIYIEQVKSAIEMPRWQSKLSGKIYLHTEYDENYNEKLHIDLENSTRSSPDPSQIQRITQHIDKKLIEGNSEYRDMRKSVGDKSIPIISLHPHGHQMFRPTDIKQKWTKLRRS